MMYIITYDLNRPHQDYPDLIKEIKSLGNWKHPQKSTWFVISSLSTSDIYHRLGAKIDKNDTIFIAPVEDSGGQMPPGFWDWYNQYT